MPVRTTIDFVRHHPLTKQNQLRAFGRILAWQFRARLQREVIVPFVNGTKLAARRGMYGATGNIYVGLHEFEDMAFVLHVLRPGELFVDVGANVGSYTVLASGVCGADTIACEPDPESARWLRRNVEINNISSLVDVREVAAGARSGRAKFSTGQGAMNHVLDGDTPSGADVEMSTLDNIVGGRRPALLKLDTEGHEEQALKGAGAMLDRPGANAFIVEGPEVVTRQLLQAGFGRYCYDPFRRALTDAPRDRPGQGLFIRDVEAARHAVATAAPFRVLGHSI